MVKEYDVVLATCNGSHHILDQLSSISSQSILPTRVIVGDDISRDNTLEIINNWSTETGIKTLFFSSEIVRLGPCRNFEKLLSLSSSPYVMLSDQDDLWHPHKAEMFLKAIQKLELVSDSLQPLLIYSDLRLIDSSGNLIAPSFFKYQNLNPYRFDWLSLAFQNIVTGCSCMVNRKCIDLALPFPSEAIMHDWWLALIASHLGQISYIPFTYTSYRQHSKNVVGAKGFYRSFLLRLAQLSQGIHLDIWINYPMHQLIACSNRYPSSDSRTRLLLSNLISSNRLVRVYTALRLGLSKHGILRTLVWYFALFSTSSKNLAK